MKGRKDKINAYSHRNRIKEILWAEGSITTTALARKLGVWSHTPSLMKLLKTMESQGDIFKGLNRWQGAQKVCEREEWMLEAV